MFAWKWGLVTSYYKRPSAYNVSEQAFTQLITMQERERERERDFRLVKGEDTSTLAGNCFYKILQNSDHAQYLFMTLY